MWIPQYDDCGKELWYGTEEEIDGYIRGLGLDPRKTVRVSPIASVSAIQFVLPKEMLNGHGGNLGLTVKCYIEKDLPKPPVVDWKSWEDIANLPSMTTDL